MKKIEAIIRPEKLEPLKDAMLAANVDGMTIYQVLGCGNQHGWTAQYRGHQVLMNTHPKVFIMLVVADNRVNEILEIITKIAQTGEVGDGKIFISDVEDCIRIRTGESGDAAI